MRIPNPFFVFHECTLTVISQLTWWMQYHRDVKPTNLAVGSMTIGLAIIILGVAVIDLILVWFLGAVIGLPFLIRKDLEARYRMNTAHGHKNKAQSEWPYLTGIHCFCLCLIAVCTHIPGTGGWAAVLMAIGVYVMLVVTLYILATDPLPPRYGPAKRRVAFA